MPRAVLIQPDLVSLPREDLSGRLQELKSEATGDVGCTRCDSLRQEWTRPWINSPPLSPIHWLLQVFSLRRYGCYLPCFDGSPALQYQRGKLSKHERSNISTRNGANHEEPRCDEGTFDSDAESKWGNTIDSILDSFQDRSWLLEWAHWSRRLPLYIRIESLS